ncbi:MAG: 30S ribosomal protein S5 [Candidatus Paceibacterota bacterium]
MIKKDPVSKTEKAAEEKPKSDGFVRISSFNRFSSRKPVDKEFESKLLDLARVTHVRAGGKRMGFRAVIVSGNHNGKIGVGVATGLDVAQAVEKATRLSKKNMITVAIINDTILHQVEAKFGASRILLKPQKKGRGLVAGGTVRVICTLSGIKNISSKVLGRTGNKLNNALATVKALQKLKAKEIKK